MTLSVAINTKNAALTLEKTLKSVKFADEIVVVDMHSTDNTVKIAQKYTDKIFQYKDVGFADPARNFAFSKTTSEWILMIDADEVLSPGLIKYIKQVIQSKQAADIYLIPRQNVIFNKKMKYTGWWPDYQPRLFKKGHIDWPDKVHQHPVLTGNVKKVTATEHLAILHLNYPDVSSFISRLNRYTSLQAHEATHGFPETINSGIIISNFFDEFFKRFFVFSGFKDNVVGTGMSFLQACYELVVKLKIWELQSSSHTDLSTIEVIRSLEKSRNHLNYWLADWHIKNSVGLKQIYWKIRRKFQF